MCCVKVGETPTYFHKMMFIRHQFDDAYRNRRRLESWRRISRTRRLWKEHGNGNGQSTIIVTQQSEYSEQTKPARSQQFETWDLRIPYRCTQRLRGWDCPPTHTQHCTQRQSFVSALKTNEILKKILNSVLNNILNNKLNTILNNISNNLFALKWGPTQCHGRPFSPSYIFRLVAQSWCRTCSPPPPPRKAA